MAINRRLEKLEEAEHAKLNAEFQRLEYLFRTGFSEAEKIEIAQLNNFYYRPTEEPMFEFLSCTDLAFKQCFIERLQGLIEKWQSSLRQRATDPNWDISSLIDEAMQQQKQG